jgi:hypothetical protein
LHNNADTFSCVLQPWTLGLFPVDMIAVQNSPDEELRGPLKRASISKLDSLRGRRTIQHHRTSSFQALISSLTFGYLLQSLLIHTMKLSTTFFLLPFMAYAAPVASPQSVEIAEITNDRECYISDATTNCYSKPATDARVQQTAYPSDLCGVRCRANGITSVYDWDYIPGWNCWIPSGKLNECSSKSYNALMPCSVVLK